MPDDADRRAKVEWWKDAYARGVAGVECDRIVREATIRRIPRLFDWRDLPPRRRPRRRKL